MAPIQNFLITGGTHTYIEDNSKSECFDLLAQAIAPQARHDSEQLYDQAKCHPDTHVAILTDLEEWAEGTRYNYPIKWISGSAGVGKTAIMRTIAEILKKRRLLLADFFFWRSGNRCNTADFFIATLAYQISISLPATRPYIEDAVKQDPHIFTRTLEVQSRALIVNPINSVYQANRNTLPLDCPRILVVDGLDECLDEGKQFQDIRKQVDVLRVLQWTLSQLPARFALLIASRPEYHIQRTFDTLLKDISSSTMLNDSYDATTDIGRFYLSKFREIREHHPLRSYLPPPPNEWPSADLVERLVHRASGQFIYASTVVKFIALSKKNPSSQLDIILGADISSSIKPLQALDLLYSTILSQIEPEDLTNTLRVLGVLLIGRSRGGSEGLFWHLCSPGFWDKFLGLQCGEVQRLLLGLESILSIEGPGQEYFRFYHATLEDFLFDPFRSGTFFIDKSIIYEDMARQSLRHLWTTDDRLRGYMKYGMNFWFEHASPSMALHSAVEQVESRVHPTLLKLHFPAFLGAVRDSKLTGKMQLYKKKQDTYKANIASLISIYLEEKSLVFLMLVAVVGQVGMVGRVHEVVDEACPLPQELIDIDKNQGFSFYQDSDLTASIRRRELSTYGFYSTFITTVESVITDLPEASDLYATAATLLIRTISQRTRSASLPQREEGNWRDPTTGMTRASERPVGSPRARFTSDVDMGPIVVLQKCLRRASSRSGLSECIKKNPISPIYLELLENDIDAYMLVRLPAEIRFLRSHSIDSEKNLSLLEVDSSRP